MKKLIPLFALLLVCVGLVLGGCATTTTPSPTPEVTLEVVPTATVSGTFPPTGTYMSPPLTTESPSATP